MLKTQKATRVVATVVSDDERMTFLPRFFGGRLMMYGEALVFDTMRRLSPKYRGGLWKFYTLSNGGYYMAPHVETPMHLSVSGNWFEGELSGDAAGIVVTLFALSALSIETHIERIGDLFHLLRDYAIEHAEARSILAAID